MGDVLAVLAVAPDQAVVPRQAGAVAAPLEQVAGAHALHPQVALDDRDLLGPGHEHPDHRLPILGVLAQKGERVVAAGRDQPGKVFIEHSRLMHGAPLPEATRPDREPCILTKVQTICHFIHGS